MEGIGHDDVDVAVYPSHEYVFSCPWSDLRIPGAIDTNCNDIVAGHQFRCYVEGEPSISPLVLAHLSAIDIDLRVLKDPFKLYEYPLLGGDKGLVDGDVFP